MTPPLVEDLEMVWGVYLMFKILNLVEKNVLGVPHATFLFGTVFQLGRKSGPVTCDVEEAEEHEKNIENEDGVVDCSDLFQENKAVGRGRGIPGGRRNNIQSAEDCQAECQKVPECNFFIWNSPSVRRNKLSCWLKKNDNNPKNARGRISGPREC